MATTTAAAARGKVTAVKDAIIVFSPAGTNYELHLLAPGYAGPLNTYVEGVVRLSGRKVMTVPSGGNFVNPLFGTPRTIQGRVRSLDERTLVVQAGVPLLVELPEADSAFDLSNGPIGVATLVNVTILPGARFEYVGGPGKA